MKWQSVGRLLVTKIKPKRYTTIVMMLIIWAGLAGSLFAAISTNIRDRDFLLGRAVTVADTLPVSEITALKGNTSDSNTTAYRDLKARLQRLRHDQGDLSFAYLMGRNDDGVFFYVDSEAPNSNGYSPPGETYPEASPRLRNAFDGSQAFIEGPSRDRWGLWVSALAPVIDNRTNQTVAVVGIDINATRYYQHIALYALIPLLLAAIPLAGLIRDRKLEGKEREISNLKNQFVSVASHELRSPLTGMLWAIQALTKADRKVSKREHELLTDMYRSTESSLATVNEILDLSIFERGQADKLQRDQVDLIPVMNQVIATLKLGAEEQNLQIELVGHWPTVAPTLGDVAALKRAFMNIVSNAIKYSPRDGKVDISYQSSSNEHIIAIRDHGIGIPLKEQAKVLEGYYRASNASEMQAHGTGLGLWITRLIVEQHGGRLWLRSHVNQGTTMFVALPNSHGQTASKPITKR